MNAITLYQIYETTRKNNARDLTIGLAMFHADHPGEVDHDQDKAIREFIGRHGKELAEAFPDRDKFAQAVAEAVKADEEAAKAREEAEE